MKSKFLRWAVGGLGVFFILSSLIITLVEFNRFKAEPTVFPAGSIIAGLPVGGLDKAQAVARLSEYYSLPLVLEIDGAKIHAQPEQLGFSIDSVDLVDQASEKIPLGNFWAHLWGNTGSDPIELSIAANVEEDQVLTYLNTEIVPRYTQPSSPLIPIPGTTNFKVAETGRRLNIEQAVADIRIALLSPSPQVVALQTQTSLDADPSIEMLDAFLRHNINWIGFDELTEVYLESLETGQILHFAVQDGVLVAPDVAFSAASTIKIPIMISVLRRTDEPTPQGVVDLFERMIVYSENPPADTLMSTYLNQVRGPLMVSEDLNALGMENTFLAGYFYLGAPVLQIYETPANSRDDIFLDPDIYNQTVPSEVGQLLSGIYTCAEDGGGLLTDTFPGEISQSECQLMVDILATNRLGLLIEAGLPPDAFAAHKHGWVQELDGLLHSMSDVAILFTPGGDYVLNVFIYDPVRLDFDEGNRLIARLSQTVYNFFNVDNQAHWWFD